MKTVLENEQITSYRDNGYLAVDLLDHTELEVWRQAVDEAVSKTVARDPTDPGVYRNVGRGYYNRVFVQCVNLWKTNGRIREIVLDGRLGKMATEMSGSTGVRLYHDHALIKDPWANPTNFHVDNPMDPFYSEQATMLWVALDDVTIQNGCLYFLPGSHRTSRLDITGELGQAGIGDLIDAYPEWADIEPDPVEIEAGSAIFINGMTAHAAGPNMTLHPRRAFAMLFMPKDAVFNGKRSALPEEVFSRLEEGDLLADDVHLPLLYSTNAPASIA